MVFAITTPSVDVTCRCSVFRQKGRGLNHPRVGTLIRTGGNSRVRASSSGDGEPEISSTGGVFNEQFLGVLQQSLARQGADALIKGEERDEEEYRKCATEEVLEAALNQSKLSLRLMVQWKNQLEAQIAAQEKQVSRMEFALNKSRNDAAYMRSLKQMLHDYSSE